MIKRMYPSADYKNKIGLNQPTETEPTETPTCSLLRDYYTWLSKMKREYLHDISFESFFYLLFK